MARRIQLRRDTAANWTATNPTLAQGEVGIDLTNNKIKIGNGTSAWNSLSYFDDSETSLSNYAGHIIPSTDNTYDLGAPDKQWRDIFVSEGSIYIGDIKLSNDNGILLVQRVTDAGLETETPVPDAPGVVTTDRLINNSKEVVLNAQGDLELPAKFPVQFTAVFDEAHYNGGGTFQGDGTISLGVQLQGQGAQFQWLVDDPTFNTDRGYVGQQAFRYTEADHGITGFNVDILVEVMGPDIGTGLYSLQAAFSPAPGPADLAKIRSTDELIVSAGNKGWIFDIQGNVYLPDGGDIRDSTGTSVLGGGFSGNYNDLTNKPVIPEISSTQNAGSAVLTVGLDVGLGEVSLIGTLDTGFGPNENTIGKVGVGPGQVNISSLDQDAPDVEYKSEINVYYPTGVTIRNSPGHGPVQSWVFGNNGSITLPQGSSISDLGTAPNDSVLVLGAGATVGEGQRAARIGINGDVEGVAIGAGTADWIFTNNGKLTLPNGAELWEDALIGAADQDFYLASKFTPQITRSADNAVGSTFISNIEFDDDIIAVQVGWLVNVDGLDYTVSAVNTDTPNEYAITVTPAPENPPAAFEIGTEYTFRSPTTVEKGWTIRQGTGTLVGDGGAILSSESSSNGEGQNYRDFSVELANIDGTNEYRWTFRNDGTLELPVDGDIVDQNGVSVLGGGGTISVGNGVGPSVQQVSEILFNGTVTEIGPNVVGVSIDPSINDTVRGFVNLVGDRPNNNDDCWFESVVVRNGFAYVLGSDYYITNSNNSSKVYKFDLNTGEQVLVRQIDSGRGATFNISVGEGMVVIDAIANAASGYAQGEQIYIRGDQIGGSVPLNDFVIVVDTVDETGSILTASILPGYNVDGLSGTYFAIESYTNGTRGVPCAISFDDVNNRLIVVSQYDSGRGDATDNYWYWTNVYTLDPSTLAVISVQTLSTGGDIYANSIATHPTAGIAIVGEKYDEYREFGELTLLAGYNGYFDILKSEIDEEHYPGSPFDYYGDFWVSGTGIATYENVDNVNYYTQLPSTVREGSGAQVAIGENGSGSYTLVGITAGGTNYLPGHILRVPGTDLGGTTPENDALLQIISVDGNGGVTACGISGTAFATAPVGGWIVSTVNYNVGSGATFYTNYNSGTGVTSFLLDATGSNYVIGDVLTIAGTNFAGGASPANDVTITVVNVDGQGGIIDATFNTTNFPTNALRLRVDGVDFSVEGTWSMRQNLGGEAFVWTPNWSNAIGGPTGDRFYDACWKADGSAIYAVGRGRYETAYDQALMVKFNATTGAVVWSTDIKFLEASDANREARAVCLVPNSTDIMVAGAWYNNTSGSDEIILTRATDAGVAVWTKTYVVNYEGNLNIDYEISIKPVGDNVLVTFEQSTLVHSRGIGFIVVDGDGLVVRHRVLSSDGNSNYNYYETPTANFADVYSGDDGDYLVFAGTTYVPTDNYKNALLVKFPIDGLKNIAVDEPYSIGEHILNRFNVDVTTMTSAFDAFTATEHIDTIVSSSETHAYVSRTPDGLLQVWTHKITDDTLGYLEFGDGSKQSFAANIIPQIPAANDYYLTEQDSGKHIFFEHENGTVYIPHRDVRYFPVGFTFTIVNTTGSDCWVRTMIGESSRARLKLAGRNIDTIDVGIPDSGSGSMVTVMKIKDGYYMSNSDGQGDYPDVWIISGPGDLYDNA